MFKKKTVRACFEEKAGFLPKCGEPLTLDEEADFKNQCYDCYTEWLKDDENDEDEPKPGSRSGFKNSFSEDRIKAALAAAESRLNQK